MPRLRTVHVQCFMAAIALLIAMSPVCRAAGPSIGPPCGEGAGGCYFSNSTPGCENVACCTAVCGIDSFCCDFAWDSTCADLAAELCGDCGNVNAGDCFAANGTQGCDDAACCAAVCTIDPFCCDTEWDANCAALALTTCVGCGGATTGSCFDANGSPACNNGECCDTVCAIEPFCCDTVWDDTCADLALDLCAGCGATAAGICVLSNGNAGCEDGDCCALICAIDEFCCGDTWDSICADLAIQNCTVCGALPAGNPFAANNTPNSWNLDCCNAVCAIDPFCCDTGWDDDCVTLALATCSLPCEGDVPFTSPDTVDVADLLALLAAWGPAGPFEPADIHPHPGGDGVVNVSDLLFLLASWGPCDIDYGFVQYASDQASAASVTVSFAPPAAGNLLIAVVSERNDVLHANFTVSSGWTKLAGHDQQPGNALARLSSAVYWRIAVGSETDFTFSDGTLNVKRASISEYSGPANWAPQGFAVTDSGAASASPLLSGSVPNGLTIAHAIWRDNSTNSPFAISFAGLSELGVSSSSDPHDLTHAQAWSVDVPDTTLSWSGAGHEASLWILSFEATD